MNQKVKQRILYNRMRRRYRHITHTFIPMYREDLHNLLINSMLNFVTKVVVQRTVERIKSTSHE